MLRTALSLAMITGQPFRMTNIRGKRSRPGLMRQHLSCVKAACEISDGTADGAEIGSTELVFRAGKVRGGSYQFAIGSSGSAMLLFQTLLPALWSADEPTELRLEGGTHNPMGPPFEFIERIFLPALAQIGPEVSVRLGCTGFAPAGGGVVEATIQPCKALSSFDLVERPEEGTTRIRVLYRYLEMAIAGRMLDAALELLPTKDAVVENREPGPGPGICCLVESEHGRAREMASVFGEKGVTAETLGRNVAKMMQNYLGSGVPVGRHLADQLLLPMALAGGGRFVTMKPDNHVPTNMWVIGKFLPVRFSIEETERKQRIISVERV